MVVCEGGIDPSHVVRQPGSASKVWVYCEPGCAMVVKAELEKNGRPEAKEVEKQPLVCFEISFQGDGEVTATSR